MSFLISLATCVQIHEGYFSGSVSFQNNNPGNIRLTPGISKAYGAIPGYLDFAKFPSYAMGFKALEDDLRIKITGGSSHIDYSKSPTFQTLINVYAPVTDNNNPTQYCDTICKQLVKYNIQPSTLLSDVAKLISGEWLVIPPPVPPSPLTPPSSPLQVADLERRATVEQNPVIKFSILNLIKRLVASIHSPPTV